MVTIARYFGNVTASLFVLEIYASMIQNKKNVNGAKSTRQDNANYSYICDHFPYANYREKQQIVTKV